MSQRTATGDVQQVAKNMTEELTDPDVAATEFMQFVKKLSTGETAIEGNQVCYMCIYILCTMYYGYTHAHACTHAHTHSHTHSHTHARMHRYTLTHMHAYILMHHVHTHMRTQYTHYCMSLCVYCR